MGFSKNKLGINLKILLALTLSLLMLGCASFGGKYKVQIPDFEEVKLSNGARLVYVRDRTLPLVGLSVMVSPGASIDPVGKSGLTYALSEMLEKGTKTKSADQIADAFASYGTGFSSSVDHDYFVFSTDAMANHQNEIYQLFSEVLFQPEFSKNELELFKKRLIAVIKQNYDDANFFADDVIVKQVMGSHPYSRSTYGSTRDVGSINRNDLVTHYQNYMRPENLRFILTGDYSDSLLQQIKKDLEAWNPGPKKPEGPHLSNQVPKNQRQFLLVDRKDLHQSQIRIGQVGISRVSPDYWALQVANVILGGNFTSRLMKEIRVKRGLTYGVRSSIDAGADAGPFEISTFTRHDKVGETVTVAMEIFKTFHEKGVTEEELNAGKNYLKGHLIRSFEKPEDIVKSIVRIGIYGLPATEVTDVVSKISAVSLEDVNRAISKNFHPDKSRIVIYSSKNKVLEQVRGLGALEIRPYTEFQD